MVRPPRSIFTNLWEFRTVPFNWIKILSISYYKWRVHFLQSPPLITLDSVFLLYFYFFYFVKYITPLSQKKEMDIFIYNMKWERCKPHQLHLVSIILRSFFFTLVSLVFTFQSNSHTLFFLYRLESRGVPYTNIPKISLQIYLSMDGWKQLCHIQIELIDNLILSCRCSLLSC